METFENKEFLVVIEDNRVTVTKKAFKDNYYLTLEDGKLRAKSSLALSMGVKVRNIFGF